MAQVNGGALPPHVIPFCAVAAVLAAIMPVASFLLSRASAQLQVAQPLMHARVGALNLYLIPILSLHLAHVAQFLMQARLAFLAMHFLLTLSLHLMQRACRNLRKSDLTWRNFCGGALEDCEGSGQCAWKIQIALSARPDAGEVMLVYGV